MAIPFHFVQRTLTLKISAVWIASIAISSGRTFHTTPHVTPAHICQALLVAQRKTGSMHHIMNAPMAACVLLEFFAQPDASSKTCISA